MNFKWFLLFIFTQFSFSQGNTKVVEVDGGNWIEVLKSATYFIDTTNAYTEKTIVGKLNDGFVENKSGILTLNKQPHNLWVNLKFKNLSIQKLYWLSIYSQADTIIAYERKSDEEAFAFKKLTDYTKPSKERSDFNVRFHYVPFEMERNQTRDVLLLVKNRKHYTNFYVDFTPPQNNLNWEKDFYWIIGSFVSVYLFIAILCFIFGIAIKNRLFLYYSLYLFWVTLLILQEELFISIIKNKQFYSLLFKINSTFIMLVIMGLSIKLFLRLFLLKLSHPKIYNYLIKIGIAAIVFGLTEVLINVLVPNLNFTDLMFNVFWDISLIASVLCVFICSAIVFFYFQHQRMWLIGLFLGLVFLVVNPVIYYLNYSNIIDFYTISYPNYYYYAVLIETLALGVFIIIQFKAQINKNISLLKDKIEIEEKLSIEKEKYNKAIHHVIIETQQELLKNLSNDLHDDLGQKLSVINFSLENLKLKFQSEEIEQLKQISVEVSHSIRNLSHWLKDFEFQKKSICEIIRQDTQRISKLQLVHITVDEIEILQLTASEKIILFRIYQELLNNSLKYAKATQIRIQFYQNYFTYLDNGIGFTLCSSDGIGLKIIQERVQLINWKFEKTNNKETAFKIYRL